jgi:hypothetical protein
MGLLGSSRAFELGSGPLTEVDDAGRCLSGEGHAFLLSSDFGMPTLRQPPLGASRAIRRRFAELMQRLLAPRLRIIPGRVCACVGEGKDRSTQRAEEEWNR